MKLSKHTVILDNFPKEGLYLVYNTRTQAQVVVDKTLRERFKENHFNAKTTEEEEAFKTLGRMGIVVEDSTDEDKILEEWFKLIQNDRTSMRAMVLTTYDCNFACPYCVEAGVRKKVYMDDKTAKDAADYITKRISDLKPQKFSLTFYGGEPLMNIKTIRTVSSMVKGYCENNNIEFSFGITTNGSLLTTRVVDQLIPLGLRHAKITIDGTREFHNKKRPFANGKGSFDVIIKNILSVADKIDITVGGNFDEENVNSIPELLDYLKELGLDKKLKLVNFKPIFETINDMGSYTSDTDMGCVFFRDDVMENLVKLRRIVLEKGFKASPGLGVNVCTMVMSPSFFVIDPQGILYRCPAFVGYTQFSVGDIYHYGEEDFSTKSLWKRCKDCSYVPLCGDGCLYAAYIRFGDPEKLNCQKSFMEYMIRENLKINYEIGAKRTS